MFAGDAAVGGSESRRPSIVQDPMSLPRQPKTFTLSARALFALPYRLCNPPTTEVKKRRTYGVVPIYKVDLDDVLQRKHLPPLGLKDFEEWLLYVERCPENLYFILWLEEYTTKYQAWAAQHVRHSRTQSTSTYRVAPPTAMSSSALAMFYLRAKQTFLTPNAPYELRNVPSDALAPFHTMHFPSPHPDPAVFAELRAEVRSMLEESLARFVKASYTNVGTYRALCGIVGGSVIAAFGTVPPVVYNIVMGRSRWLRLTALPGLWLGLMIILAAYHGVCMMIYVFGDLRQLRKFELSRPVISRPQVLTNVTLRHAQRPSISGPLLPVALTRPPHNPQLPRLTIPVITPPSPAHIHPLTHRSSRSSMASSASSSSSGSSSSGNSSDLETPGIIHISPAFYDEDPAPEGPATAPHVAINTPLARYTFPNAAPSQSESKEYIATASFIHPFDSWDESEDEEARTPVAERQRVSSFDFDRLPPRPQGPPPLRSPVHSMYASKHCEKEAEQHHAFTLNPRIVLGGMQTKCAHWSLPVKSRVSSSYDNEKEQYPGSPTPSFGHPAAFASTPTTIPFDARATAEVRLKKIQAVPAFASPLTRVLSPVVTRAQWEIVMRSSVAALLLSWVILGPLLAVPEHH
ncbi:hypothetical protein PLICRDRAFT_39316, partial [Plicaturopsis crispa FD-325 SS-3]